MFALGATPITSEAPGGESVRDDQRYDKLEQYFQGLEDVPWDQVINLASGLLEDRGKDLKVAAQLGVALSEERSWSGLVEAYACWKGLLSEEIWPHIQPKRPRGQANAIIWFVERVGEAVRGAHPGAEDIEVLEELRVASKEVELLIDERMGEKAPQVGSISRIVKGHIEQLELDHGAGGSDETPSGEDEGAGAEARAASPGASSEQSEEDTDRSEKDVPKKEPKAAKKAAKKATKKAPPAKSAPVNEVDIPDVPGDGASLTEGEAAFRQLKDPILQTLENIRRGAPDRPLSYRLSREWVWALATLPSAKAGQTSIPSPGTRDIGLWDAMASRGEWTELLHSAENRWPKSMFWLDPHRYVGQALEALGLDEAHSAVGAGVAQVLNRLPEMPELSFVDGTPLADAETIAWIAAHAHAPSSSSVGGGTVMMAPVSLEAGAAPKFLEESENLLKKNKFVEAVLGFESGLARVPDRRVRFTLKLQFAQQLLVAKRVHVARPMLEALDEEVESFQLETWEPRLAAGVVQTLLAALSSKGHPDEKNPEFAQKLLLLRVRLARLDAPSALETGN
jgi:type VI secretion system protein VasJ